jgi:hypothetical protein
MAGVRGEIATRFNLTQVGTNDLGAPKMAVNVEKLLSLYEGTDATNKANILFSDTRTLAASSNENIDFSGALTDAFGASIVAAEVVALLVTADAANVNNVQVTRPASNGFIGPFLAAGDGVAIKPGEWMSFVSQSGWAVTAATGDLLNIANSGAGTSVTYSIIIVGRTAAA